MNEIANHVTQFYLTDTKTKKSKQMSSVQQDWDPMAPRTGSRSMRLRQCGEWEAGEL